MCIAVYVPAGSGPVPFSEIQTMWENNPDGAGIAVNLGNTIQILKGFTSPEYLYEVTKDLTAEHFIHFRIGTHGGKRDPKHTHPFPIGKSKEEMEECSHFTDEVMMHNGIMYKYGDELDISDSMKFARDFLGCIRLNHPNAKLLIENEIGDWNKVAIMKVGMPTMLVGKGWIQHEGRWYSNEGYLPSRYSVCDPREWGSDKDDVTWMSMYIDGTLENSPEIMHDFFDEVQWVRNTMDDSQWLSLINRKRAVRPKNMVDSDWDIIKTYRLMMKAYEGVAP